MLFWQNFLNYKRRAVAASNIVCEAVSRQTFAILSWAALRSYISQIMKIAIVTFAVVVVVACFWFCSTKKYEILLANNNCLQMTDTLLQLIVECRFRCHNISRTMISIRNFNYVDCVGCLPHCPKAQKTLTPTHWAGYAKIIHKWCTIKEKQLQQQRRRRWWGGTTGRRTRATSAAHSHNYTENNRCTWIQILLD